MRAIGAGVLALILMLVPAAADAGGGVWLIETFEELEALSRQVNEGGFFGEVRLMNDIKAERPLTPIGSAEYMFEGLFDGQGYAVSGLRTDGADGFSGLFGCVGREGMIRNLTLENVLITGGRYSGAAAGYSAGRIENCTVQGGRIIGNAVYEFGAATGGVVGLTDGSVEGCRVLETSVFGMRCAGGIAGSLCAGEIKRCLSSGRVISFYSGEALIGGIAGSVQIGGVLRECICLSEVRAEKAFDAGGIAGGVMSGEVIKCVFLGSVCGREPGAIAGYAARRAQLMSCRYDPSCGKGVGEGRQDGTLLLSRCGLVRPQTDWLLPLTGAGKQN